MPFGMYTACSVTKPVHHDEIEIKLRVLSLAAIHKRLKHLHAREIIPRTYESNTLFDTPQQHLRSRGQIIRLRIVKAASAIGKSSLRDASLPGILTYKGPSRRVRSASTSGANPKRPSRFKVKEEVEVSVSAAMEMPRILRALGLRPSFRYEKFRTTYTLPGLRELKVELDETPVGVFLELEGPEKAIDRAARILGYGRDSYMKDSYGSLHLSACRAQGRKPGDMLFPPTKKLR
jgi:adenylate cyclase class 2